MGMPLRGMPPPSSLTCNGPRCNTTSACSCATRSHRGDCRPAPNATTAGASTHVGPGGTRAQDAHAPGPVRASGLGVGRAHTTTSRATRVSAVQPSCGCACPRTKSRTRSATQGQRPPALLPLQLLAAASKRFKKNHELDEHHPPPTCAPRGTRILAPHRACRAVQCWHTAMWVIPPAPPPALVHPPPPP